MHGKLILKLRPDKDWEVLVGKIRSYKRRLILILMNIRKFFKAKIIRQVKKLSIFVFLLSFALPNEKNFSFKFNQHTDIDSWQWISKNNFGKNFKESSYDFIIPELWDKPS